MLHFYQKHIIRRNDNILTDYSPVLFFYTPENIRKTLGFLMFSGGIEKQHRAVMG